MQPIVEHYHNRRPWDSERQSERLYRLSSCATLLQRKQRNKTLDIGQLIPPSRWRQFNSRHLLLAIPYINAPRQETPVSQASPRHSSDSG